MPGADPSLVFETLTEFSETGLSQVRIVTIAGSWSMTDRGELMSERFAVQELSSCEIGTAEDLVQQHWSAVAAAALRMAVATDFDEEALHALDVMQGFTREDWERPWQPGTAEIVDAMLAAAPQKRTSVAAQIGLRRGIPR